MENEKLENILAYNIIGRRSVKFHIWKIGMFSKIKMTTSQMNRMSREKFRRFPSCRLVVDLNPLEIILAKILDQNFGQNLGPEYWLKS